MRTIHIDTSICDIPTYSSATEAIAREVNTSRAKRSALDSSRIVGTSIRDFTVSDQIVRLYLSSGDLLEVLTVGGPVEWRVSGQNAGSPRSAEHRGTAVRLLWANGEVIWRPAILLETRREFPLQKLFAGQVFVNIYFGKGGVLQFFSVWNRTEQSPFLYFEELEPCSPNANPSDPNCS